MPPAELIAILRKTQSLIADPRRWTEHHFAEDKAGKWVPVGSEHAVRFNLAGAVIRSAGPASREAMRALTELLSNTALMVDSRVLGQAHGVLHSQALELLGLAIRQLESSAGLTDAASARA